MERLRGKSALAATLAILIMLALLATACRETEPAAPQPQTPDPTTQQVAVSTPTTAPTEATPVIVTQEPETTMRHEDATYGGVLRKSAGDDLISFDPMIQTTVRTQQRVGAAYNRLFRFSFYDEGVLLPDLADRWEVSEDALTYNITLRDGIKFHDIAGVPGSGTDLDCQDVAHSLNKYRDPEWSNRSSDLIAVESVSCGADRLDVEIRLSQSDAGLIAMLGAGWSAIIPSELPYEDMDNTVIGTGPFVWQGYTKGGKAELEKNPDYWRDELPYLDGIDDLVFPEETASFAAFRAQQLDVNSLMQYLYPEEGRILKQQDPSITVSIRPRLWWHAVQGKWDDPIWSNPNVRQAFSLAFDRPQSTEILNQGAGDVGGWQPPWSKWSLPREELDEFVGKLDSSDMEERRARARQLLGEAGYEEGSLSLSWLALNTRESMLTPTYGQDQLKLIGVNIELEAVDRGTYNDRQQRRDFQLKSTGGVAPVLNPSLFYGNYFLCDAPANYGGYCDEEFDAIYRQQLSELDESKRQQLIWEMERKLLTELPSIHIRWVAEGMAWWPWVKNFHDVDPAYYNNVTLEEVWMDKQ